MSIHKINSSKLIKAYISPKNIDKYLNIKIQNIEIQNIETQNIETQNIKSLKIKKIFIENYKGQCIIHRNNTLSLLIFLSYTYLYHILRYNTTL